jgi:hypothetical protein
MLGCDVPAVRQAHRRSSPRAVAKKAQERKIAVISYSRLALRADQYARSRSLERVLLHVPQKFRLHRLLQRGEHTLPAPREAASGHAARRALLGLRAWTSPNCCASLELRYVQTCSVTKPKALVAWWILVTPTSSTMASLELTAASALFVAMKYSFPWKLK